MLQLKSEGTSVQMEPHVLRYLKCSHSCRPCDPLKISSLILWGLSVTNVAKKWNSEYVTEVEFGTTCCDYCKEMSVR